MDVLVASVIRRRSALPVLLGAAGVLFAGAAPARASIAYEHHRAIWVAADDGTEPRRLATGFEPHLVPGGASKLWPPPRVARPSPHGCCDQTAVCSGAHCRRPG